ARRAAEQWRRTQELLEERSGVAETLQRAMLTQLPQGDGLALAARYLPAHARDAVGGDWYDAFDTPDGATVVAVGDISGHDITAAADMGQLRTLLRGYAVDRHEAPSATMARLDRAMGVLGVDALATVVLGRVECDGAGGRTFRWTNAGHPPPLLLQPDGRVEVLTPPVEILVGVRPETRRSDHVVPLPADSTLLLYSDGLIEQRAGGRDIDVGTAQLVASLTGQTGGSLDELLDRVLAPVVRVRDDDVVVLAIRPDRRS
ncbi:hypothetical protein A7K94_0213230, partial [Modestobacter sp. VKM Ac-2676]